MYTRRSTWFNQGLHSTTHLWWGLPQGNQSTKNWIWTPGHPGRSVQGHCRKLAASGDKNSIRKFTIFLNNCVNAKHCNFDMTHMDSYQFLRILAGKLPVALIQVQHVGKYRDVDHRSLSLEDFEKFTAQISRNANDPRIAGLGYQPKGHTAGKEHTRDSRGFQRRTAYATAVCHTESKNATSTNQKT